MRDIWALARKAAIWAGAGDADADDVAQCVTMRLWLTWDRPNIKAARRRGVSSWNGYVVIAGRNAWRDLSRSDRRRQAREVRSAALTSNAPLPVRPGPSLRARVYSTRVDDIDEYLARIEIVDAIATQLTGRQQRVAWHIFVDGWSVTRVASELGLTRHTVRVIRTKATTRIRAALLGGQESYS
jgi:RNA polymerase sigma factor (sigma-70 family)